MIYSKVYSLCFDDYYRLEKFKVKRNRTALFSYLICLSLIAVTTFDFIHTKSLLHLCICAAILVIISVYTIYVMRVKTRRTVRRILNNDLGYLGRNEVRIYEDSIEFRFIPILEKDATVETVYPYALCSAIYECDRYYYFVMGDETRILPKMEILPSYRLAVNEVLKRNINYIKTK